VLTDFVAGCHAGGRWPLIVVGRSGRPPDLQKRVHREPLGVFGRVLVLGPVVPTDGGGTLFAEHVQDETTFETHTKIGGKKHATRYINVDIIIKYIFLYDTVIYFFTIIIISMVINNFI